MRRFWSAAAVVGADGAWTVALDGRAVRTPARAALALPTRALADAVANEWAAVREMVDPRAMPLTGLANAAIDRVAPDPAAFAAPLAAYAEGDLLCYRAEHPPELVAAEADAWDKWVAWAAARLDLGLRVGAGVSHVAQPPGARARVAALLAALDPFRLAALDPLVRIGGSAVLALAVLHGELAADDAFATAHLDELWQAARWGEDAEAAAAREGRRRAMVDAGRFLALL